MKYISTLFALSLGAITLAAQVPTVPNDTHANVRAAINTATAYLDGKQATGATLPGTCGLGALFTKTGASAGLYSCGATNVWTLLAANVSGTITANLTGLASLNELPLTFGAGLNRSVNTIIVPANGIVDSMLATGITPAKVGNGTAQWNANQINSIALSGLGTGILKNTTGTGVPSIAIASDFPTLNQNTTGTAAALAANGTNCSAGTFPLGVDASGNSEGCTAVALTSGVSGILPAANGGTGVNNTVTETLGTTAINWATLGTGIIKNTTTTGAKTIAVAADFPTLNQNTTGTAAALAANGTNCSAGSFPLGIDASGNSEGCTSVASAALGNCTIVSLNSLSCPGDILSGSGTTAGGVSLFELAANGTNAITLGVPDNIPTAYTLQLPAAQPAAGQTLSFSAPSGSPLTSTATWSSGSSVTAPTGRGFWFPANNWGGDFTGSIGVTANQMKIVEGQVPAGFTVTKAQIYFTVGAASSTAYVGIYDATCSILTSGSVASTSTGAATVSLTPLALVTGGTYYIALADSSASVDFGGMPFGTPGGSGLNAGTNPMFSTAANAVTSGVMPSSCGALTPASFSFPYALFNN
jgi:hypothetical protein